MGFIKPHREELRSRAFEDLIPKEAKCRFVVDLVGRLDLTALYARYSRYGRSAYDPATLLATWFFAYCEGISSTRALERACRRDLHFIYVSGSLRPDHTSLSRFRQRTLDLMGEYFEQMVCLARADGHAQCTSVAIDSTTIEAAASARQSKTEEELRRYLKATSDQIKRLGEESSEEASRLGRLEERLEKRLKELTTRKATLKKEHRDRHQMNLTDPEACYQGRRVGYKAQVAVDTKTQLILGLSVTSARNDQRQLIPQLEALEKSLGSDSARQYVADSGYHSLEALEALERSGPRVLLADPAPQHRSRRGAPRALEELLAAGRPLERSDFSYDALEDRYTCPAGEVLHFRGERRQKSRRQRRYEASRAACSGCLLQALCLKGRSKRRRLWRDSQEHLAEAMHIRSESPAGKALLSERRTSVEPTIGNLKANLGFRRFSMRGLAAVNGEWALMCIGHNLGKLYRFLAAFLEGLFQLLVSPPQSFKEQRAYDLSAGLLPAG